MSIDRRFGAIAAAIGIPLVVLSGWLLSHQWRAFSEANQGLVAFQTFRGALVVMEKISFERGPTNGVLGEALPISPAAVNALDAARRASDSAIATLDAQLDASHCANCAAERRQLQQLRTELAAARANVDALARQPRAERKTAAIAGAVDQMVALVPLLDPITDEGGIGAVKGDPAAVNCIVIARLAATLREQAGLLGSRFTPALASQRALTEDEEFAIERTQGGIDRLRELMEPHVDAHPALTAGAYPTLNRVYFGDGEAYVAKVRVLARRPQGAGISTRAFALTYVPLMRPIVDFRNEVLDLSDHEIRAHREFQLELLLGTCAFAWAFLVGLVWLVWMFREHIVRPFSEAARVIRAIALGDHAIDVPSYVYRGEIRALFEAIDVLKTSDIERTKLELERYRLIGELRTMADTDSLTQLYNRRAFEIRARAACADRCVDRCAPDPWLALVMFDVDHFKRINDTHGHATGDRALQKVADLCRETWRRNDIVARIGGEEFAVLVGVAKPELAIEMAHRLRDRLSTTRLTVEQGGEVRMTASFGVAFALRADEPRLEALLKRADGLLYRAKLAGRDRVEAEPVEPSEVSL